MGIRLDKIGFGNLKIFQDTDEFCYGIDAVLLADFASKYSKKKRNNRMMDLGTGTGIVPLILSHKTEASYICGIEVQENSYNLGKKNIELNNLDNRVEFINGDISYFNFGQEMGSFDVVTSNPPYTAINCGIESNNNAKLIARHETTANLDTFISVASRLLKDKGDFCIVHRPSRIVDICESCRKNRLEPKEIQFVSGKIGEKPNIMLVHCVKNGNKELKFLEPLFVYENGEYSLEVLKIYDKL